MKKMAVLLFLIAIALTCPLYAQTLMQEPELIRTIKYEDMIQYSMMGSGSFIAPDGSRYIMKNTDTVSQN